MRIPPKIFWAMSIAEWRAVIAGASPRARVPMKRSEFEALLQAHPDR